MVSIPIPWEWGHTWWDWQRSLHPSIAPRPLLASLLSAGSYVVIGEFLFNRPYTHPMLALVTASTRPLPCRRSTEDCTCSPSSQRERVRGLPLNHDTLPLLQMRGSYLRPRLKTVSIQLAYQIPGTSPQRSHELTESSAFTPNLLPFPHPSTPETAQPSPLLGLRDLGLTPCLFNSIEGPGHSASSDLGRMALMDVDPSDYAD